MTERVFFRLEDIKTSIANIRTLLHGKNFEETSGDPATRAALERFLEIISEASRHIPVEWKEREGQHIPWRQIADIGNVLRHAYHQTDLGVLWSVYTKNLAPLETAVDAMLAAHRHPDPPSD